MNKSGLIEALASQKDLPLAVADRVIGEILGTMSKTLIADDRIEIRVFGSFENRQYNGHTGRNPKTGEFVTLKSKKLPFFNVGKEFKERIMDADG